MITSRRADRLASIVSEIARFDGVAISEPGDVTDERLRQRLIESAHQHFGGLDVLINNAGIGGIGQFAGSQPDRVRKIMEVNFFAPVELIRLALPLLRESESPAIVNIGSVLGHCSVPKKSEYSASKFALHGFTDALRMELARDGIDVLLISPSTTDTEFFEHADTSEEVAANRWAMSPEAVAQQVIRAIERGQRERILSLGGKLLVWCDRLFPRLNESSPHTVW